MTFSIRYRGVIVMNRPRLVHITASLQMGGAEQSLFHLVRSLRADFDQHVISFRDGVFAQRIRDLGVPVYCVPYSPLFLWHVALKLKELKPSVIHTLLWSSGFVARFLGKLLHIPVVYVVHSPVNSDGYDAVMRTIIDRLTIGWARQVVAVSQRVLIQTGMSGHVPACRVICNGVDGAYVRGLAQAMSFEQERLALHHQIHDGHFVIGAVGRLVALKNQRLLIQVLARLHKRYPQIRVLLVGEGPLRGPLNREAERLGVARYVQYARGDAYLYYPLFDVFVLPSYVEGLSMALLEAMSFGVPAVVASAGNDHDVIESGQNGLLFAPDNLDQLEAIIIRFLQDNSLRQRLSEAGFATVEQRFSWGGVVEQYASLFRQCAGKI